VLPFLTPVSFKRDPPLAFLTHGLGFWFSPENLPLFPVTHYGAVVRPLPLMGGRSKIFLPFDRGGPSPVAPFPASRFQLHPPYSSIFPQPDINQTTLPPLLLIPPPRINRHFKALFSCLLSPSLCFLLKIIQIPPLSLQLFERLRFVFVSSPACLSLPSSTKGTPPLKSFRSTPPPCFFLLRLPHGFS